MTQKTTPTPTGAQNPQYHYIAIDIAKESLELLSADARSMQFTNDQRGLRQLVKWLLEGISNPLVVCEATGGYERPLLGALREAKIALALLAPSKLRAFAGSEGVKAKTDKIDARMILRFAQEKRLEPMAAPDPKVERLAAWMDRRSHLTGAIASEKNRLQNSPPAIHKSIKRMLCLLEKELATVDRELTKGGGGRSRFKHAMQGPPAGQGRRSGYGLDAPGLPQ